MANRWGNNGNSERPFWGAPKSLKMVTAAMKLKDTRSLEENYNQFSILKSRDITLPTKVHLVKAIFPVVMCGYKSWSIKKAERWRIDAFELWYWRRLWWLPWTARRSNQSILKEINPEYSLEGLMLQLKLQLATWCKELTHWKRPWCWVRLKVGGKGMTEDEMVEWHHWLDGHEFEQTPGDSGRQRSLVCYSPWGHRVGHDLAA